MKHPHLCRDYMKNRECTVIPCKFEHVEMDDRPHCDAWFENAVCPYGDKCYYPHVYPKQFRERRDAAFAVQVPNSMSPRVRDYLLDAIPRMPFASDIVLHDIHDTKGHGYTKRNQRVLLVNTTGPQSQIDQILIELGVSPVLRNALVRGYVINYISDEWDEVIDFAKSQLKETGSALCNDTTPADSPVTVHFRTQCYPNTLEETLTRSLAGTLEDIEINGSAYQLEYTPKMKGWDKMVHLVYVNGCYYCGVISPDGPTQWGHVASKNVIDNPVSRAQYKLTEAMIRTGVFQKPYISNKECFLESKGIITPKGPAIDVGASPGGWSVFLASRGYSPVYAVDPGNLNLTPEQHRSIIHLKMRGSEAIEQLKRQQSPSFTGSDESVAISTETEESMTPSVQQSNIPHRRLNAYACDANISTYTSLEIFKECVPLLAPHAPVVITLKNFDGPPGKWLRRVKEVRSVLDEYCDQGQLIHLMSNGSVEMTYIGWLKKDVNDNK